MNDTTPPPQNELTLIDKIFYINLSRRTDRDMHFIDQMKKHRIPPEKFERFDAINGVEYIFPEQEINFFKKGNVLTMVDARRIMGNQMSHFKLFQLMIERNYKCIIICQDDIIFKDGFAGYIDEVSRNLPDDAEIVHFGFHKYAVRDIFLPWDLSSTNIDEISHETISDAVCRLRQEFTENYNCHNSTGYILTLNGAKNYVEYVLKNGFEYGTDVEMSKYLVNKGVYYGSRRVLATTVPTFGSDVFSNIHNKKDYQNNPYKLNHNNSFLNYLNTYNWTNDLPANTNAKVTFVSMLSNFITYNDKCELLEVGAFAGTSVVGMLQYLPYAHATAVDNWDGYIDEHAKNDPLNNKPSMVEQVFFENISKARLNSQVSAFKCDMETVLKYLRDQNKRYNFIHINDIYNPSARYTECLYSWGLLKTNGIMAINNYAGAATEPGTKGIGDFLDEIPGQYIILESGYILFIKKIYYRRYRKKTVIQIGSHVGNTGNDPIFRDIDETTKLVLVEPVPYLFSKLRDNYTMRLKDTTNITFINKAVSDFVGEIELTIPSERNDWSALPTWASQLASVNPNHATGHIPNLQVDTIRVCTTTIDDIIKEFNITEIDLLHTDTEGHDYNILMNYSFVIKPRQILFEYKHMDGRLTVGQKYDELSNRLRLLGYMKTFSDDEDALFVLHT
jgi:FkbM family methyltransferase